MTLTFGSLFAGIGGFDLGFERAGMTCKWQVEIDDYANKVLAKHWPNVTRWRDVRTFPPKPESPWLGADWRETWGVDVICGGFPCTEISVANQGKHAAKGIDGPNSGLWCEFARVVDLLRPRVVVVENSPAITSRGLGRLLGDLANIRYDAEWARIPAGLFGTAHKRNRVFVLAWQAGSSERGRFTDGSRAVYRRGSLLERGQCGRGDTGRLYGLLSGGVANMVADANIQRREGNVRGELAREEPDPGYLTRLYGDDSRNPFIGVRCKSTDVYRKRDGVPNWSHRLRGLGNAVVPQVSEWIGRQIVEAFG